MTDDEENPNPLPFSQLGEELLARARETAQQIQERVKKLAGDPAAETREMSTIDTKEQPALPDDAADKSAAP